MKQNFLSAGPVAEKLYFRDFHEYLLVAYPDRVVNEKLLAEKQLFYDKYKEKFATPAKPYIKIAGFLAREGMEDTIIRWMQRICSKQPGFSVTLNNYGCFPPDTIYLRIQNTLPFQQLAKELHVVNNYVSSSGCPDMEFVSRPHVSIAKRLPEEIFFKALTQYAHKSFHESFLVSELLLLKRIQGDEACKPVNVFAFRPIEQQVIN